MTLSSKKVAIILAISVMLNFVALGFYVTQNIRGRIVEGLIAHNNLEYPAELRDAYKTALKHNWFALLKEMRTFKQLRQAQQQTMIAEKFDKQAFIKTQHALRDSRANIVVLLQDALPEAIEAIPKDIRMALPIIQLNTLELNVKADIKAK